MVTVAAPAKINLTLEVLGRRADGYHEIRSVMQVVNLCDELSLNQSQDVAIGCNMPGWSAEKSLVSRAVALVKGDTGCSRGVSINIAKKIPLMSGLGGDSSDAAAVLKGLNELWQLGLPVEKLTAMAGQLGADVGFFLQGGTALAEGRGGKVTSLPPLPRSWVVLIIPDISLKEGKTARIYSSLTPAHYTDGKITQRLVAVIKGEDQFDYSLLFNTFENVVYDQFKIRRIYVEHLMKLGAPHVHLAGSGPALFTLCHRKPEAEDLYTRCRHQGMKVCLAETI
jgi:4-diphosphocytidyl-2-C-methyl-D-erythritol kinase